MKFIALLICTGAAMPPASSDEATLRALVAGQTAAWNRNDASAWCSSFADDASFINIRGDVVHGHPAIEALHRMIFAGPYKGSHADVKIDAILFPAPGIAIIESTHEITHEVSLPPGVQHTEPGLLRAHMKYILKKSAGSWQIIAGQNTAELPRPAGGNFVPQAK